MSRYNEENNDDEPEEKGVAWENVGLAIGGVAAGLGLSLLGRRLVNRWTRGGMDSDLVTRIISSARHLATPSPPLTFVGPGEDRWDDQVCGGLVSPGEWQWYRDGNGTTCAVWATAVLASSGLDVWTSPLTGASGRLMINYPAPRGVGYIPGAWDKRFVSGGDACGIRKRDADLKPGDLYYIVRGGDPARWHVGIVLERDGERLLTADGGQTGPATATAPKGCQCARLTKRTLRGKMLGSAGSEPGEVQWRITWP